MYNLKLFVWNLSCETNMWTNAPDASPILFSLRGCLYIVRYLPEFSHMHFNGVSKYLYKRKRVIKSPSEFNHISEWMQIHQRACVTWSTVSCHGKRPFISNCYTWKAPGSRCPILNLIFDIPCMKTANHPAKPVFIKIDTWLILIRGRKYGIITVYLTESKSL